MRIRTNSEKFKKRYFERFTAFGLGIEAAKDVKDDIKTGVKKFLVAFE
jgi:hypothetical protein